MLCWVQYTVLSILKSIFFLSPPSPLYSLPFPLPTGPTTCLSVWWWSSVWKEVLLSAQDSEPPGGRLHPGGSRPTTAACEPVSVCWTCCTAGAGGKLLPGTLGFTPDMCRSCQLALREDSPPHLIWGGLHSLLLCLPTSTPISSFTGWPRGTPLWDSFIPAYLGPRAHTVGASQASQDEVLLHTVGAASLILCKGSREQSSLAYFPVIKMGQW